MKTPNTTEQRNKEQQETATLLERMKGKNVVCDTASILADDPQVARDCKATLFNLLSFFFTSKDNTEAGRLTITPTGARDMIWDVSNIFKALDFFEEMARENNL